jgi:hypothetical protein
MVFKIFSRSSDFIILYNIFMWFMQKNTPINIVNQLFIAKQSNSSWSVFETCEIPVGVLLVSCSFRVEHHCSLIKYIGVVSTNYPCALLDSYSIEQPIQTGKLIYSTYIGQCAQEKFAKMTPTNNIYWSYFYINHVKTLIINLKSLESLTFFKTVSSFSLGLNLLNNTWKVP